MQLRSARGENARPLKRAKYNSPQHILTYYIKFWTFPASQGPQRPSLTLFQIFKETFQGPLLGPCGSRTSLKIFMGTPRNVYYPYQSVLSHLKPKFKILFFARAAAQRTW